MSKCLSSQPKDGAGDARFLTSVKNGPLQSSRLIRHNHPYELGAGTPNVENELDCVSLRLNDHMSACHIDESLEIGWVDHLGDHPVPSLMGLRMIAGEITERFGVFPDMSHYLSEYLGIGFPHLDFEVKQIEIHGRNRTPLVRAPDIADDWI